MFIQKIPKLGIYALMFTGVIKTFVESLSIFLVVLLAFAFAFKLLWGNHVGFFYFLFLFCTIKCKSVHAYAYKMFPGDLLMPFTAKKYASIFL